MRSHPWHFFAVAPFLWSCHPSTQSAPAGNASTITQPEASLPSTESKSIETSLAESSPVTSSPAEKAHRPSKPLDTRNPLSIQAAITAERPAVRTCYEAALKTNPGIAGDLVVDFVIRPDGSVKNAEINWPESDIHVPELEVCTLAIVSQIQFPASSRGMESKIHYPYNFHPGH